MIAHTMTVYVDVSGGLVGKCTVEICYQNINLESKLAFAEYQRKSHSLSVLKTVNERQLVLSLIIMLQIQYQILKKYVICS